MSVKSDFDGAEWDLVAEGPVTAGMIVLTADSGGTFRETLALARSYRFVDDAGNGSGEWHGRSSSHPIRPSTGNASSSQ